MSSNAINPTRSENYSEWFHAVIKEAELAEQSPVRGCIVIKPWGFAIWERIQHILDKKIKDTGHENAYFPLFIPLSFIEKESKHIDGFATECAVVTHRKLIKNQDGKLIPDGKLEEPLIVRPTSETIIGHTFSEWIHSYRDLPLLINQWANIVRWEMRTRPFLRTSEFLWQEGHTAHATKQEAIEETLKMLNVYKDLVENYLAVKTIEGKKTKSEMFPGAETSYCIEGLMQDKKALQMGTSHYLGQNFSKSFNIQFNSQEGNLEYVHTTSWGVSTRLIGALIMSHSDDNGLVLPPKIAPKQIIILPIKRQDSSNSVKEFCEQIKSKLLSIKPFDEDIRLLIDDKDIQGGTKKWKWIKKGAPLIIEIGAKEVESKKISILDRTTMKSYKIDFSNIEEEVINLLTSQQENLLKKSSHFIENNIIEVESIEAFYNVFENDKGLAICYCSEGEEFAEKIKTDLQVTSRCIPISQDHTEGKCIFTGQKTKTKIIFGKAY